MNEQTNNIRSEYTGTYLALRESTSRINVCVGGAGSGKTYAGGQFLVEKFNTVPDAKILVTMDTLPALKTTIEPVILKILSDWGIYGKCKHNLTDRTLRLDDRLMLFSSTDREGENRKSEEWNWIYVEEANRTPETAFNQLRLRLRAKTQPGEQNKIILSLNPVPCWIQAKEADPDFHFIYSNHTHNPFLDEAARQDLVNALKTNPDFARVYTLGQWGTFSGLIYPNWEATSTLPTEYESESFGLDFGFNNPTALVRVLRTGGTMWVQELLYRSGLTNSALIGELKQIPALTGKRVYCDTAPERIEELQNHGIHAVAALKDVKPGIDFMKRHKVWTVSSPNIEKEQQAYVWKKDARGEEVDEPVKFKDHALDAIRYAAYTKWGQGKRKTDATVIRQNAVIRDSKGVNFKGKY